MSPFDVRPKSQTAGSDAAADLHNDVFDARTGVCLYLLSNLSVHLRLLLIRADQLSVILIRAGCSDRSIPKWCL